MSGIFFVELGAKPEQVRILYPNGGEILKVNTTVRIRWFSSNGPKGKVILVLYKKGIKHSLISKGTADTGRFTWKIPGKCPQATDYRIRIRLAHNLSINDFSDRDFTIKK
jgi:hypothetical protein